MEAAPQKKVMGQDASHLLFIVKLPVLIEADRGGIDESAEHDGFFVAI